MDLSDWKASFEEVRMYALATVQDPSNVLALVLVFSGFAAVKTGTLAIMWWGYKAGAKK